MKVERTFTRVVRQEPIPPLVVKIQLTAEANTYFFELDRSQARGLQEALLDCLADRDLL